MEYSAPDSATIRAIVKYQPHGIHIFNATILYYAVHGVSQSDESQKLRPVLRNELEWPLSVCPNISRWPRASSQKQPIVTVLAVVFVTMIFGWMPFVQGNERIWRILPSFQEVLIIDYHTNGQLCTCSHNPKLVRSETNWIFLNAKHRWADEPWTKIPKGATWLYFSSDSAAFFWPNASSHIIVTERFHHACKDYWLGCRIDEQCSGRLSGAVCYN